MNSIRPRTPGSGPKNEEQSSRSRQGPYAMLALHKPTKHPLALPVSLKPECRMGTLSDYRCQSDYAMSGNFIMERDGEIPRSDIEVFVLRRRHLTGLLFPVYTVYDGIVYVARWQNYALSLCVMFVLCFLLYFPTLFLVCLLLASIIVMAIGRYYSSTQPLSARKLREPMGYILLDEDEQALKQYYREQKSTHKLIQEYKQLMKDVDNYMVSTTQVLEHLYRIVMWKSTEVSLCVVVLLCILAMLLCTFELHKILAAVPIFLLCLNRHFIKRSVDTWKVLWRISLAIALRCLTKLRRRKKEEATVTVVTERQESLPEAAMRSSPSSSSDDSGEREEPVDSTGATATVERSQQEQEGGSESDEARHTISPRAAHGEAPPTDSHMTEEGQAKTQSWKADNCTKCSTSFAKLLKRRHTCSNCGQLYCGSCTVKVKRAFLGATSPAAYEESVRICLDCKARLE